MRRILLVEDDAALGRGVALALRSDGEVELRCDCASALAAAEEGGYDLAILDVNLPDGNGLDVLKRLREIGSVPVILLTCNDLETDQVAGFELGADDYVTKPFSLAVLRARVNAQLRRSAREDVFEIDGFRFDFAGMEFRKGGASVELSRTEQKLLRLLVENRGRTLPRALLLERLWPDGAAYVDENALSVAMKRLRDKLEDEPSKPRYLRTVYGVGYQWAVKP